MTLRVVAELLGGPPLWFSRRYSCRAPKVPVISRQCLLQRRPCSIGHLVIRDMAKARSGVRHGMPLKGVPENPCPLLSPRRIVVEDVRILHNLNCQKKGSFMHLFGLLPSHGLVKRMIDAKSHFGLGQRVSKANQLSYHVVCHSRLPAWYISLSCGQEA